MDTSPARTSAALDSEDNSETMAMINRFLEGRDIVPLYAELKEMVLGQGMMDVVAKKVPKLPASFGFQWQRGELSYGWQGYRCELAYRREDLAVVNPGQFLYYLVKYFILESSKWEINSRWQEQQRNIRKRGMQAESSAAKDVDLLRQVGDQDRKRMEILRYILVEMENKNICSDGLGFRVKLVEHTELKQRRVEVKFRVMKDRVRQDACICIESCENGICVFLQTVTRFYRVSRLSLVIPNLAIVIVF